MLQNSHFVAFLSNESVATLIMTRRIAGAIRGTVLR
jgi:hypothetical protein